MPSKPNNAAFPETIEGWRSPGSHIIILETYVIKRSESRIYLMRGYLSFGGWVIQGATRGSDTSRYYKSAHFQIVAHFPDGSVSVPYGLTLNSGSPIHPDEKSLEQLLLQHIGHGKVEGVVGGRQTHVGFVVNYVRTPAVEAVIKGGRVLQMRINQDA